MHPDPAPPSLPEALDAVPDLFTLIARDWTVVHLNSTFERLSGQRRDTVVGRNLWEAFPQVIGTKFETEARAAMESGQPRVYEEKAPNADRWMQMRAFPSARG